MGMRKWFIIGLGLLSGILIICGLALAFYGHNVPMQPQSGCTVKHGVVHCIAPIHPTLPSAQVWQHPYLIIGLALLGIGICVGIGMRVGQQLSLRQRHGQMPV
jgi:MFS family permease